MTFGLEIFARSLSIGTEGSGSGFEHGNTWQYHPRSDRHSKILCWGIFFDLLLRGTLIRRHVDQGLVGFGINHKMRDFAHDRKKDLDLVICKRSTQARSVGGIDSFKDMVKAYTISLNATEAALLQTIPEIPLTGVQTALVALEAKAAMTAFGKALPRLYDELNSSHLTIHGDTDSAIAAGFGVVNFADTFISPIRNPWIIGGVNETRVNVHKQPRDAISVIEKLSQLPRRSSTGSNGFDAFGLAMIRCPNDGTSVELICEKPAPQPGDAFFYENFLERIETIYANRFAGL